MRNKAEKRPAPLAHRLNTSCCFLPVDTVRCSLRPNDYPSTVITHARTQHSNSSPLVVVVVAWRGVAWRTYIWRCLGLLACLLACLLARTGTVGGGMHGVGGCFPTCAAGRCGTGVQARRAGRGAEDSFFSWVQNFSSGSRRGCWMGRGWGDVGGVGKQGMDGLMG
ncbi:hypothetical protein IWX49DRAFT_132492 [Phyllosticta citricarpa]